MHESRWGYRILYTVVLSDKSGFALGYKPINEYITWRFSEMDGQRVYYDANEYDSEGEAYTDFFTRLTAYMDETTGIQIIKEEP